MQDTHSEKFSDVMNAFDVLIGEFPANPYPIYTRLREYAPVLKTSIGAWLISRYDDVDFVLSDRRFGKNFEGVQQLYHGPNWQSELSLRTLGDMMLFLDPPRHTIVRTALVSSFSAKRVTELKSVIISTINGLLDRVINRENMDLVSDFAVLLPKEIMFNLFDIPMEDRSKLGADYRVTSRLAEAAPMNRSELDSANQQISELIEFFRPLVRERRHCAGQDLISALARHIGELSEEEVLANVILLFVAGYETTSNLIANAFLVLEQNPAERAKLISGEVSYDTAIDELIRFESPVQAAGRMVMKDVAVGGVNLEAGQFIILALGASNRDGSKFHNPDGLDLSRRSAKHHSFGGSSHYCLGAQLARIELQATLEVFFQRLRNFRVDAGLPLWQRSFAWRGLKSLHAKWDRG